MQQSPNGLTRALVLLVFLAGANAALAQQPNAEINGAYAKLPGVDLWYIDSGGDGEPVVFLHAATGNSAVWENQIPAFTKAGYRFISYDRRGFRKSKPNDSGPQPGSSVDDLQALLDYLEIDKFHLVATAAGGFVGLDYAVSHQDRLNSLVIANTMGLLQDPEMQQMGRNIRPQEFNALPHDFKELSPSYRAINPEGVKRWNEFRLQNRAEDEQPVWQMPKNPMTLALMETIKVPTLFISGEADPYMPPPVMRVMVKHVAGSKGEVIPETSHSAFWEQPEIFNRVVLDFIGKH